MSEKKKLLIVAGETSGDFYAASLINILKKYDNFDIYAIGSNQTKKCEVNMLYDSSNWAAIGIFESVKQVPKLIFVYNRLRHFCKTEKPDLVILVDYPGFNMRIVHMAKSMGIPTLYIFPPGKFVSDPKLVKDAAESITKVAANFTYTYEIYKAAGANVEFIGHPVIDNAIPELTPEETCEKYGLDKNKPVIALCPGSRLSELTQLLPVMLETGKIIHNKYPEYQFVVPVIETDGDEVFGVNKEVLREQLKNSGIPVVLAEGKIHDIMNLAKILLISSGTATLEASYVGTPMIICYKVAFFTEIQARLFYKLPQYIGLPSLILKRKVTPELIQHDCTPQKMADEAFELLENPEKYEAQKAAFKEIRNHLGNPGVLDRVANMIYKLVGLDDTNNLKDKQS